MGMYAVDTASSADLAELVDGASGGRAAAVLRRRQEAQGKEALNGGGAPPAAENLNVNGGNGGGAPPAGPNGEGASNGAQGAPDGKAVATNGVAEAHHGRAVSMQRRRQMAQGKGALNGGGAPPAENLNVNGVNGAPPAAPNGQGAASGAQRAPERTAVATNGVAEAHHGRAVSMQRRRQMAQGKVALNGGGPPPAAAANGQGAPSGAQRAPERTAVATNGVAEAHLGRALSMQRRRQMAQGKVALNGAGSPSAAAGAGAPPAAESPHVDGTGSGREQARARRAQASRSGSAGISRPQRQGRVTHPPKVIESPTHRGQRVTGLRIGPGVRVTGDEAGAALPVSGPQYFGADGPAPASGAGLTGRKVGRARTPEGLVVSGTMVRNKVPITGDEPGEHLPITGEADQKLDDDLTQRSDGTYRPTQFPRRADPHGATAVGTRLGQPGMVASSGDGPGYALANTDDGLPVTGTAVGLSGRVTGNEAGVCRPITGDQYQDPLSYSSQCGGTGGGTAPAAHLNRSRLDPVTAGKVTVAQTWGGQQVTGPSVEHRPNVTGDEPGACRPVTGTPYQGPSTVFGWCELDEGESAAHRLEPRPEGVALTGDLPMSGEGVTGTTEIGPLDTVTGTPYYGDLRAAEPAADDWAGERGFPVALARRLAGRERAAAATQETGDPAPPPSSVPGGITGSFAVGDGMVTGNNEFLFRPRPNTNGKQPAVTGEGRTEGRAVTGSAWTANDLVTGTEGYIAAGRNPSEGGGGPHGWAGAGRFAHLATPGGPRQTQIVTGRSGWSPEAATRVTLSGGAQG
ncbi:MAG TPA: CsoS2 family carboxysome shell protein [Acidimicrobiales bacterium]|nr:CsoS2 family carboxysome shell protein [Acidimicrobiales bacterium]